MVGRLCLLALLLLAPLHSGLSEQAAAEELGKQETPAPAPQRRPKLPSSIVFESSLGDVHFPHRVHQKMGCQNCHHQIHAKDLSDDEALFEAGVADQKRDGG